MPQHTVEPRQASNPAGRYVTIEEAAIEAGVAERTIQRWKQHGKLHTIHDRLGHVRVSLEDVLACRPVPSESPLRSQVMHLHRAREALTRQVEALHQEMKTLRQELEALRYQHDLGERLVQALPHTSAEAAAGDASPWREILHSLSQQRLRSPGSGLAERLARRGLPAGTQRLCDFASEHAVPIHEIKKLYEAGEITLSVHHRQGNPRRNQKEWWITPLEQQQLVATWQQQGAAYQPCPRCPHASDLPGVRDGAHESSEGGKPVADGADSADSAQDAIAG